LSIAKALLPTSIAGGSLFYKREPTGEDLPVPMFLKGQTPFREVFLNNMRLFPGIASHNFSQDFTLNNHSMTLKFKSQIL